MKVICINENFIQKGVMDEVARPHVGEECDVIDVRHCEERRQLRGNKLIIELAGVYYNIRGYKHWFRADHFATLPDKSADEMREEEKEAIVNIESPVTI